MCACSCMRMRVRVHPPSVRITEVFNRCVSPWRDTCTCRRTYKPMYLVSELLYARVRGCQCMQMKHGCFWVVQACDAQYLEAIV